MSELENIFGDADPSFEQGSAPTATQHLTLEVRKDFLPWHKPRKQWIRAQQWASPIAALAEKLKLKELHEPLRYLSLPGPDLLDVRSIRPVCEERNIELQFVGLNGGDDDADVARTLALENQVRAMPGIHAGSEVVKDRFEQLGVAKSLAHSRIITAQRSFDVVNVDLCGSFAEQIPEADYASIPSALLALIRHQARHRSRDWLLFVTTRSDLQAVKPETMDRFINAINEEINKDPQTKSRLIELNLFTESDFNGLSLEHSKLTAQSHSNAFSIGFAYWVLNGLADELPAWRADMLDQIEYHVAQNDPSCDMLSLGFWCRQLSHPMQPDSFGIAKLQTGGESPLHEVIKTCIAKVKEKVSQRIDLDRKLHLNKDKYQIALNESADLLAGAMYDKEAYLAWAESERENLEIFLRKAGLVK